MSNRIPNYIAIVTTFILLSGCANVPQPDSFPVASQPSTSQSQISQETLTKRLNCKFYIPEQLAQHASAATPYELEGELAAGVVTHHLLAGHLISSFFARAAQEKYDTVIVIGPSHFPNDSKVLTTADGWATPFGNVDCDADFVRAIKQNYNLNPKLDSAAIEADHAIGALVPYIAKYLPGASLGVVLMANGTPNAFQTALAQELFALSQKKKVLVVGSIDFSHYLSPQDAAEHDKVTAQVVEGFDFTTLDKMKDDNIDSPETMATLLTYLQLCSIDTITQLDHTSSDQIVRLPLSSAAYREGVTTYFIYGAVKNQAARQP